MAIRFDQIELANTGHQLYPVLQASNATRLRIQSTDGYVDIGSGTSSSYGYLLTDRANFYVDKPVSFDGNISGYGGDETASFALYYDRNNTAYYLNPSGTSILSTLTMYTAGATETTQINMPRAGFITFYGDNSQSHSISSRNASGTTADDLRINSYGALYINLDSNNNNTSAANFMIGRHGGQQATISDWAFKIDGETFDVGIGTTTNSDGDLSINAPKLHVKGVDTSGAFNLIARFQGGSDDDNTGAAILINHNNDRGLLLSAGRKDSDREVAYFDLVSSGANITRMFEIGKYGSDYISKFAKPVEVTGRLTLHTGGTNTYGLIAGYGNDNHFITMRGKVTTGTSTLTVTGAHQMTFVEHADDANEGWYYVSKASGNYTEKGRLDGLGNMIVTGSHRAPIFYDSNDTNYYTNPNGTSVMSALTLGSTFTQNGGDFIAHGTQTGDLNTFWQVAGTGKNRGIATGRFQSGASNSFTSANNANWIMNIYSHAGSGGNYPYGIQLGGTDTGDRNLMIRGVSNGTFGSWARVFHENSSDLRSPIFYDSNDTNYYVDPNNTGISLKVAGRAEAYQFRGGVTASGDGDDNQPFALADDYSSWAIIFGEAWTNNNGWGIFWAGNDNPAYSYWSTTNPNEAVFVGGGNVRASIDLDNGASYFGNQVRTPILYDSGDTGYYVDPASGSKMSYLGLNTNPNTSGGYRLNMGGSIDMNANNIDYISQLHFNDNVRFFDDGNDNYLNFKWGDTNNGGIKFVDGGGALQGYVYGSGNGEFGILDKDGDWTLITDGATYTALRANNNEELIVYTDRVEIPGDIRAPYFYDRDDTGYYLNPAGASNIATLNVQSVNSSVGVKSPNQRTNYVAHRWTLGNTFPQAAAFDGSFQVNGSSSENSITYREAPSGGRGLVWIAENNDTSSNADGGWAKNISNLSDDKSYISITYVKRVGTSTSGSFYHGCHGSHTLNMDGTANTNPYFIATNIGNLTQDVWCVSIGIIQANNDSNTNSWSDIDGVYRLDTGERILDTSTFKMKDGSTSQSHRTYLYYSTDSSAELHWYNPGFYEINGQEPSLNEILNRDKNFKFNGSLNVQGTTNFKSDITIASAGDANSPSLRINNASSNTFNHSIESFNSNLTSGETELIAVGKQGSTKNSGYIGYYWSAAGSDDNYVTIGHWGNDHLFRVHGSGSVVATTNMQAPIFYDYNNTAYYVNPAGTSVMNDIEIDDYIVHKGDTNTYLYFESDSIKLRTGGDDRLWVNNDRTYLKGKVGINTTDPDGQGYSFAEDLVILGGNSASDGVGLTLRGNGKTYGVIAFGDNDDDNVGEIYYSHDNDTINFRAGGTVQLVLSSNTVDGRDNQFHTTNAAGLKVDSASYARIELDATNDWSYVRFEDSGTAIWDLATYDSGNLEIRPGGSGSNRTYFTSAGISISEGSKRAPIFYDSDDTNYYLNPAASSTSFVTKGDWRVPSGIAWSGEYTGGGKIQHHSNHWYIQSPDAGGVIFRNASAANRFIFDHTGGYGSASGSWRAPIFYDSANTSYYVDPASYSLLNGITMYTAGATDTGSVHLGRGAWITFYGNSDAHHGIGSRDTNGNLTDDLRINSYHNVHINLDSNNNNGTSDTVFTIGHHGQGAGTVANTAFSVTGGGIATATSDMRAPVFYDTNDTTYFTDPASRSLLNNLDANHFGINNSSSTTKDGISLYGGYSAGEPTYGLLFTGTAGLGTYGSVTSDWATYFTMNNNDARGWIFRKVGVGNTSSISAGGVATFGSSTRSPIFYDNVDTTYYINPAGSTAGLLKGVLQFHTSSGNLRGYIEATETNDAHFTIATSGGEDIAFKDGGISGGTNMVVRGDGNVVITGNAYADAYYDDHDTNYYVDPGNTGSSVYVKGDVVAYGASDERLKDNIKPIDNALDKVCSLSGNTFEWNEISHRPTGKKDIGVIAQEVEKVFPEIVDTRDSGYKAVDYQKLSAVLIEAVKELKTEIEELKDKCNGCTC